jgi:hypothetical protein
MRVMTPPQMHNDNKYIISPGNPCRWLGTHPEGLGIEIYAGFAGSAVLYDADGAMGSVTTGDFGVDRDGQPTEAFTTGIELQRAPNPARGRVPRLVPCRSPSISGCVRRSRAALLPGWRARVVGDGGDLLHIDAQNCVPCKTCDTRGADAEHRLGRAAGRGGPNYSNMM